MLAQDDKADSTLESVRASGNRDRAHQSRINPSRLSRRLLGCAALAILLGNTPAPAQRLGEKRTTTTGHVVTVYSISWPTPLSSVAADVEVCAGPDAPPASFAFPSFFQVRFADGGVIASYGSKKQPTLERTELKPKQCARGWLDFAVTSGQTPVAIRYHEMSAD